MYYIFIKYLMAKYFIYVLISKGGIEMNCQKDDLLIIEDIKKNFDDFFLLIKYIMSNSFRYEEKLPIAQLFFLQQLKEQGEYKVSELAKDLGITPAAVTNLSNKFVNKGFVHRYRPDYNRRIVMLSLTLDGINYLEKLNSIKYDFLEETVSILSKEDLRNIVYGFSKLNYALRNYKNKTIISMTKEGKK
ncbi:hypothetical protein CKR_0996 [Clostridium kluyveri NBRC 12016]|nr:hypothetical protein CKR_0996 [Clostridium kluyveri NBRC 12016]